MVGYWAFDEGEGTVASNALRRHPDIFGSSGTARVVSPVWVDGKHGQAIDFSGARTAVLVDKTRELDCERQVTIAAWVKLASPKARCMVVSHEYAYRLCVNQGRKSRVRLQLNLDGKWAGNWLAGKTALESGRWYHLAGVYDGKERRIYIDGKLDASQPAQGAIAAGKGFIIGAQRIKATKKRVFKQGGRVGYQVAESFAGVLDEVRVWNRALSQDEIKKAADEGQAAVLSQLKDDRDLHFYTVRCVSMLGDDTPCEVAVFNGSDKPFSGTVLSAISGVEGKGIEYANHRIGVGPGQRHALRIPFAPKAAGPHTLSLSVGGKVVLSASAYVLAPQPRQAVSEPELTKVLSVDLTEDLAPDAFCHDGTSKVVQSPIGPYREAGTKKLSRFVARLPLRMTGLHLVRVTYPDDKERTCEIATWSPVNADRFNGHTGYFTGGDYPISGKLQTFELVMWARHMDQALVFTTWLDGQPAAASRIDVFEIEGRLPARPASQVDNLRHIGHYWEDAQPLSRCFGGSGAEMADFDRTVVNLCDYLDYTGQNVLMHPVVWYRGPIYNSLVEARGKAGGFHLPTAGWMDILLERFEERGLKFHGLFNVHELPSLMRNMNADGGKVRAGEPTFNSVSKDNDVFVKTWHHRASMFNALHPRVQRPVLALVEELVERYASSPAFAGIGFHLTMAQLLQPGSLEVSYDDWTVGQFERDAHVRIPASARDPERFGKRHEWIMENARDQWIRWRCERVAAYYGKVAGILMSKRRDLRFVVTILEPPMSIMDPQRLAWMRGKRLVELSREGGLDPALLAKHPGLIVQQRLGPTAKRKRLTFGTERGRWGCPPPTQASIDAVRGMDFAEAQQREYRTTDDFAVFLYNRYFENAIGRRRPLASEWYRSIPWRASAIVPAHDHFMDYYAHALAVFDPALIAIGGFTNGTVGHESRVERFARVFRQLPTGKWQDIADLGEHVVGRTTRWHGKRYVYLVNRSCEDRLVVLRDTGGLEPIGGSPPLISDSRTLSVTLSPYQLAAWTGR